MSISRCPLVRITASRAFSAGRLAPVASGGGAAVTRLHPPRLDSNRALSEALISGKVEAGPGGKYAYGFEDERDKDGSGWAGHGGGAPGLNGDLRIYPKSGNIVAVLANLDPPAAQQISEFLDARLPREK